jgi:hypothetical protein
VFIGRIMKEVYKVGMHCLIVAPDDRYCAMSRGCNKKVVVKLYPMYFLILPRKIWLSRD